MRLVGWLLVAISGWAQAPSVTPPVVQTLPSNWIGLGAGYNTYARPQVNGWMSYGSLLTEKAGGIYSFTTEDITSAHTHPFTVQTSIRTGFATIVKRIGPIYILGLLDGGAAMSSVSFGGAFSGGGISMVKLGHSNWTLAIGARVLKVSNGVSQTIYEIGLGHLYQ
jgi:hypothetical protein